jgi:O-antigen ligase
MLWLYQGNLKKKLDILKNNIPFLFLFSFIGLLYLSLLWSDNIKDGLRWLNFFKYYILLIPVIITTIKKEQVRILLDIFVFGILIYSILSLLIYLNILNIYGSSSSNPKPFLDYVIF